MDGPRLAPLHALHLVRAKFFVLSIWGCLNFYYMRDSHLPTDEVWSWYDIITLLDAVVDLACVV